MRAHFNILFVVSCMMLLNIFIKTLLVVFLFNCYETKVHYLIQKESSMFRNLSAIKTFLDSCYNQSLCVWSENTTARNTILTQAFQHVIHFPFILCDYKYTHIAAHECHCNIIFVLKFSKRTQMFKDRIPAKRNEFLVYEVLNHNMNLFNSGPNLFKNFGLAETLYVKQPNTSTFTLPYNVLGTYQETNVTSASQGSSNTNLEGRNLKVATFNCSLFSILHNSGKHDGIEIRMLRELAHQINFTWTIVELRGIGKWGEMLLNGSWVGGIMGALENGEADIGFCNVWNVLRYNHIVEFGPQYNIMYFSYMVPRPHTVGGFFTIIIKLFDKYVWFMLLATSAVVSFLYCRFRYFTIKPPSNSIEPSYFGKTDQVECILIVFGVFISSTSYISSRMNFPSQVMTWWSVFSFFISSLICNTIITRLMIPQLSPLIDTIEDIVNRNMYWGEPGYINNSKRSIYFNINDPWQLKLESKYCTLTKNTSRAALQTGKFVLPVQRLGNEYVFINVDGLDPFEFKKFRVIKQTLNYFHISFAFRKHSHLLELSRTVLQRFYELGLVEHWKRDVVLQYGDHEVKMLLVATESETLEQFKPLTFSNLEFALKILLSGWALSIFVFIIELMFKSRHKPSLAT